MHRRRHSAIRISMIFCGVQQPRSAFVRSVFRQIRTSYTPFTVSSFPLARLRNPCFAQSSLSLNESAIKRRWRRWARAQTWMGPQQRAGDDSFLYPPCCLIGVHMRRHGHGHLLCVSRASHDCDISPQCRLELDPVSNALIFLRHLISFGFPICPVF